MAKKKKVSKKGAMKITKNDFLKMERAVRRNNGEKLSPGTKVHKSKKTYTRKPKHKKGIDPKDLG